MKRMFPQLPLFLPGIFLVALIMRLYRLGEVPGGFYIEELTNTWVGRFILQYGRDIYGNLFPLLYFDKFGDFAPVLPLYLSGVSSFFFGFTEFAGRFPIAVIGALTVFPMYTFAEMVLKSKRGALAAAFFVGVIPWHVVLSRTTAEGVVGMIVYLYGIVFAIRSLSDSTNRKALWLSVGLMLVSYFLYPGLRILVPMTYAAFPFLAFARKQPIRRWIVVTMIVSLVTVAIAITPWGRARYEQTSLFKSPEVRQTITTRSQVLSNGLGDNQVLRARIFHNKLVLYGREFIRQYFLYFSPLYLFFEAGGQYRYYNVPDQGLLYITMAPLMLLAVTSLRKKESTTLFAFIVYLLAIAPISSALTVDFPPHVHRSMFMIIPLVVIAAYGVDQGVRILRSAPLVAAIILLGVGLEILYFWNQYAFQGDKQHSVLRNDGDKALLHYIKSEQGSVEMVIIPTYDRLPMSYAFYMGKLYPETMGKWRVGIQIDEIDGVQFVKDECPAKHVEGKLTNALVVDYGQCTPLSNLPHHEIKRKDSTMAYRIYRF